MKNLFPPLFAFLIFPFLLQAQYPSLDPSFNEDGVFMSNLYISDIAVLPDQKILVIGNELPLHLSSQTKVKRLNPDHGIDETFGEGGEVEINFITRKIYIQSDGKIIIGGTTIDHYVENVSSVIILLRLNPDGSVDTDFGDNGQVYLDHAIEFIDDGHEEIVEVSGGTNEFRDLGFQSDGKIVVVGHSTFPKNYYESTPGIISYQTFSTFRLNIDGTLDQTYTSFEYSENSGKVKIPIYIDGNVITGYPSEMVIQPDDKIVILGVGVHFLGELEAIALVRLNPNGTIDNTFNAGNTIISGTHHVNRTENLELQDDGKIIIGGTFWNWFDEVNESYQLLRINEDGTVDLTYGDQGFVSFPDISWDHNVSKIFLLPNQELLVYKETNNFPLTKIKLDGSIDEGFNPPIAGNRFALQDQEKLLVAGQKRIARYTNFMEAEPEYPAPIVIPFQNFSIDGGVCNVLGAIEATNADPNTTLGNWKIIGGTGAAIFSLDENSGEIKIAKPSLVDFKKSSYTLNVTVSDGSMISDAEEVTINIPKKVTVCHKNKQNISVSKNAAPAQLKNGGCLGACNSFMAAVKEPELLINDSFKIYPNPVKEQLNVFLGSNEWNLRYIEMYDLSGTRIARVHINGESEVVIPCHNLKPHLYLIRLVGDQVITKKIILE